MIVLGHAFSHEKSLQVLKSESNFWDKECCVRVFGLDNASVACTSDKVITYKEIILNTLEAEERRVCQPGATPKTLDSYEHKEEATYRGYS